MGLREFIQRIRTRPPSGERVELKPAEQVVLAHLLRFDTSTILEIRPVIEAMSLAAPPDASDVMTALVAQGLTEARLRPEQGSGAVAYVPTAKGRRLKGRLPQEPRTVTDFWI